MVILLTLLMIVAPFLIGAYLLYRINYRRTVRYKQVFLPVVALIYSLILFLSYSISGGVTEWVSDFFEVYIPFMGTSPSMLLVDIFCNVSALFGFLAIKGIYRAVMDVLDRSLDQGLHSIYSKAYEYDDVYQQWFFKEKLIGLRKIFRNLFICAIVISIVLLIGAWILPTLSAFQNVIFCALPVLILEEIYSYLSGETKEEFLVEADIEDEGSSRIFQYAKLQEVLNHYFEDINLQSGSRAPRRQSSGTHSDFLHELTSSENHYTRLAGAYFKSLVDKGVLSRDKVNSRFDDLNHDLALQTINLLEGKNVMFANPFYNDFIPYVFLPIVERLMRNKKVLVVYGPNASEDSVKSFIEDGLEFVTGMPDMWSIDAAFAKGSSSPDVGIVSFLSLGNVQNIVANADYLKEISNVIIVNPSGILATYQIGLSYLAEYLASGTPANYCVFDWNSDGLVDSLSHALRVNLTEVSATEFAEGSSVAMFWNADANFMQHRLMPGIAQYLGLGTELALVALKGQVSHVIWAADQCAPLADVRWIDGQYYGELLAFTGLPQEQLQLDKHMEFKWDMWDVKKQDYVFVIAEDEHRNLYETFRQFSTRGTKQSFVNVISPQYLLRDYMTGNAELFIRDPKAVPSLAPDFSKSRRNAAFSVLMALVQREARISEVEIERRMRYVGLPTSNIAETLNGLIHDYAIDDDSSEVGDYVLKTTFSEYDPNIRAIAERGYYSLVWKDSYSENLSQLRVIPLVNEEPDGSKRRLGTKLYAHVYQQYLPGQYFTLDGKYYQVVSISDSAGIVIQRASDHFSRRRYYRQLRTYSLKSWEVGKEVGDSRTLEDFLIQRVYVEAFVHTEGYLDLSSYDDIENARMVKVEDIPDRKYRNKVALRIQFPGASTRVIDTLAILISEFIITLYPNEKDYIAVVVPRKEEIAKGILPQYVGEDEEATIYILEDSLIDLGLVSSLDRNIERILELCYDYIAWHEHILDNVTIDEMNFELGEVPDYSEPEPKKTIFGKISDWFAGLFSSGGKNGNDADIEVEDHESPATGESESEGISKEADHEVVETEEDSDQINASSNPLEDISKESDSIKGADEISDGPFESPEEPNKNDESKKETNQVDVAIEESNQTYESSLESIAPDETADAMKSDDDHHNFNNEIDEDDTDSNIEVSDLHASGSENTLDSNSINPEEESNES